MDFDTIDSIWKLPCPELKNPAKWTLRNSEIVAHAYQVYHLILDSRWSLSPNSWAESDGSSFLKLQDFLFAAVYFRQFIANTSDHLLRDVANRYIAHIDSPTHRNWIEYQLDRFHRTLEENPFPGSVEGCTGRKLFEAFIYGAGILHKIHDSEDPTPQRHAESRQLFKQLFAAIPRDRIVFVLNL